MTQDTIKNTNQEPEKWEENSYLHELSVRHANGKGGWELIIKFFRQLISDLHTQHEAELVELLEKMKKYESVTTTTHDKETKIKILSSQSSSPLFTGYNQAIDDILASLKSLNQK